MFIPISHPTKKITVSYPSWPAPVGFSLALPLWQSPSAVFAQEVAVFSVVETGASAALECKNRHRNSWPWHESPGAGERKHVLALRKHAEHQQLSLPAAGPKVEKPWNISFLKDGGWKENKKCSEQVKSWDGEKPGFVKNRWYILNILNGIKIHFQRIRYDQGPSGIHFPSNNPPDLRPLFALGLLAGLCHVSERNA